MAKRSLQPLLLTLAFCAVPWIAVSRPTGSLVASQAFAGFLPPLPYLLLAALAFVGVKLNQTRLFFVSLFLTASYVFLQGDLVAFASPYLRTLAVTAAAPLTLGLIFLCPEGRLFNWRSWVALCVTLAPLELLAFGFRARWPVLESLLHWQFLGRQGFFHVPDAMTLFAAAFALSAFLHANAARRLLHVFLAVSLVPLWAALHYRSAGVNLPNVSVVTALAFACQALLLVYGVFLLYWERVYLDELTGIANRRALNEHLARLGKKYAVAMVDIDHFKRFNDNYGHEEGDNVLRFVAGHLDHTTKGRAYRYGGEEFTVIFEEATAEEAAVTMEYARRTLADRTFTIRPPRGKKPNPKAKKARGKSEKTGSQVRLTFSVGIAASPAHGDDPEKVRITADEGLYGAKESGRNCVAIATSSGAKNSKKTG